MTIIYFWRAIALFPSNGFQIKVVVLAIIHLYYHKKVFQYYEWNEFAITQKSHSDFLESIFLLIDNKACLYFQE